MERRVLIVDDDAGFRTWARAWLSSEGYDVVGEAGDGRDAVAESSRLHPDLVLLDVGLPDLDGFEVAERLVRQPDPPAVVLVSGREAEDYGDRIATSRARGFASKEDLSTDVLESLLGEGG